MYKLLACLALVSAVSCNDVIVGLKTDGKKFFDENRQANPALWRQMDNVTIKAPENEVISRIVITDLRPDKDGDVKIVEGGEGHKNVTIEVKSPTVLRGYEFHIEVYSSPESQSTGDNVEQQSTTEKGNLDESASTTQAYADATKPNKDTTSESSDSATLKNIPILVTNDEISENEREGRGIKVEDKSATQGTADITSTTLKDDISTTEGATASDEKASTAYQSTIPPIPLNRNYNNPAIPVLSATNFNNKEETQSQATEDKDIATSEKSTDEKPVQDNTQVKQIGFNDPNLGSVNSKYTSFVSSTPAHVAIPVEETNDEKQRNVRGANDQHSVEITSTTEFGESTTLSSADAETSTPTNDAAPSTVDNKSLDAQTDNPINTAKANGEQETNRSYDIPRVVPNYRHWNLHLNNPVKTEANQNEKTDALSVIPAEVKSEASTEQAAETIANEFKSTPDHMENQNDPKNTKNKQQ